MTFLNVALILAFGIIVGSIVTNVIMLWRTSYGVLRIDSKSDPDKDLYRIELNDLDSVSKKKRIMLRVDSDADLSQE